MDKPAYIELMLREIEILAQTSEYFSISFREISLGIGSRLEKRVQKFLINSKNDAEKLTQAYTDYLDFKIEKSNGTYTGNLNHRENWMNIVREKHLITSQQLEPWSYSIKIQLGNYILENILFKSCYLPKSANNCKEENVFYKIYRTTGMYVDPQLKVHPILSKLFSSSLVFDSNLLPMIASPLPWCSHTKGGYYLAQANLLRIHATDVTEQHDMIDKAHPSQMYPVYDSLNILSACPWKINTTILDMIIKVFKADGNNELNIPKPAEYGPTVTTLVDRSNKDAYKKYSEEKRKAAKIKAEMHSLWCTELYRLSIANMYRDKVIYFPHSLDFRGRAYPIPPHFNHLGSDIARSLIVLAEGRKLGKGGLDMLKIHLINLTGTMKRCTIQERLDHANTIIDEIIDSAEHPFNGRQWWQMSEAKWQTLACCIEIANAIKSKNPENFVSHFPIHQDGSCNGLQHYAAIGRDLDGARSVNLMPSERPNDVYSTVMDIVESKRASEEHNNEIAKILKGYVHRKVVKQTVMTTVYNVTFYGAVEQIRSKLELYPNLTEETIKQASSYLASKTFQSIRQLFTSAQEIQDWLSQCAYLISYVRKQSIKWETPLGLPIAQPYFKQVDNKNKNVVKSHQETRPNSRKQRNAFAPNYIHSLDSSHMMLTALFCEQAGIQFVSVHDCFWTHACNADAMNKICRDQFVALHSLPLLEGLSDFFIKNYGFSREEMEALENANIRRAMEEFNNVLKNVPKKGNFDLNQVKKSVYFFS